MKVEVLNGLGQVVVLPATRVLVTTDDGTPVAVSSDWMGGAIQTADAGHPNFRAMLTGLGIDRTVTITKLTPKSFDEIRI